MANSTLGKVTTLNFADAIHDILDEYGDQALPALTEAINETSKEAVKKLKQESPGKGQYHKGWTKKEEKGRLTYSVIIYGKHGTYQLAHLLEHGHLMRNGKRTRAIVHIKPVEEWAKTDVVRRTKKKLENITI